MKEIWKNIEGYEGLYQVSSEGRIRNSTRLNILKSSPNSRGYLHVTLSKNNVHKTTKIHNTVASHFIDNPLNKPTVNHINGIKTDNRVVNLEFATHWENTQHAIKTGLMKPDPRGYENTRSFPIYQLDNNFNIVNDFGSISEAQRVTGISKSSISHCCNGKRHYAGNYKWCYQKNYNGANHNG